MVHKFPLCTYYTKKQGTMDMESQNNQGNKNDMSNTLGIWLTEAATRGALYERLFLEISQNSQENACARVSFF